MQCKVDVSLAEVWLHCCSDFSDGMFCIEILSCKELDAIIAVNAGSWRDVVSQEKK